MASSLYSPANCYCHSFTNQIGFISLFEEEYEEFSMMCRYLPQPHPLYYGMVPFQELNFVAHQQIPQYPSTSSAYLPRQGGGVGFIFQHQLPPPRPHMGYLMGLGHLAPPQDVRLVSFHEKEFLVTVAKTSDHVDQWIRDVVDNYGHCLHRLIVGLDTEWRPNLAKGEDHPIAIIQLSVGRLCLVYQFLHAPMIPGSRRRFPQSLQWFLENPFFTFCGVGVDDDAKKLHEHHGLRVRNTLDLHALFRACYKGEYWCISLKNMCSMVLGKEMKKPKEVTLSAWDNEILDDDQVEYAAIDAFISLKIGLALLGDRRRLKLN